MSGNAPPVTWVITAFNQEQQVERAIESAFAQDYPNLEIIISDDCSTDGTAAVVRRMVEGYRGPHRVRANVNTANLYIGGHISLMNRLATGELVINGAGDDVSAPHRASRLVERWLAEDRRPGLLHSACYRVEGETRTLFENDRADQHTTIVQAIHPATFIIGATEAWDRAMFASFGDLRPDLTHEDHAIIFRTLLAGRTIAYVEEPLVDHHHGGLTSYHGHPTAAERKTILRRYLVDVEQKQADLAVMPRAGLDGILAKRAAYYRAAIAFEEGFPPLRDAIAHARAIGPLDYARLAAKRAVNRRRDRRQNEQGSST